MMTQNIFNWVLSIPSILADFGNWLFTDLPYINISPIAIFTVAGVALLLGFHLLRLVVGG